MNKILTITLLIFFFHIPAQSQDNCTRILEEAEQLFDQGIIEDIPDLLSGCLQQGFSPGEKMRAEKLLVLVYVFDNKPREAEDIMRGFLRDNPEYEIQPDDPAEFTLLFSGFRTIPFMSFGAFLGGNFSSASMLEQYGPYNPDLGEGRFGITSPGFQIGSALNFFLTNELELSLEGIYTINSFSYSNLQYGFADVYKKETHNRLEFPVSVTWNFDIGRWMPYLRIGGSYGLLMNAYSDYKRSYTGTDYVIFSPIEELQSDISDRRNHSFFNAVAGAGIKYKIPGGHLYLDLKYFYGLSDLVIPEERWSQDAVFKFYNADSDFHLDYLTFSIGYRYSLYRTIRN